MTSTAPIDATLIPPGLRDLDLEAIATEFGTPVFVYDEDDLRRRCREYVSAFGTDSVAYAGKAFLCTAMARLVAEEGLHVDCSTGGELYVALSAGVAPERIVLHGNNKSDAEITQALDAGVGRIVVDSFDEIDRLERLATRAVSVLVRVTPGVEAHTHEYIETGTEASKFGFTLTDGVALMRWGGSSRRSTSSSPACTSTSAPRSTGSTRLPGPSSGSRLSRRPRTWTSASRSMS